MEIALGIVITLLIALLGLLLNHIGQCREMAQRVTRLEERLKSVSDRCDQR